MRFTQKALREAYQGIAILSRTTMPTGVGTKVTAVRIILHPYWEASEEDRVKLVKRFALKADGHTEKNPKFVMHDECKECGRSSEYDMGDQKDEFDAEFEKWNDVELDVPDFRLLRKADFGEKYNIAPEVWFAARHVFEDMTDSVKINKKPELVKEA